MEEEMCGCSRHAHMSVCRASDYHMLGRQQLRVIFDREWFLHPGRHGVGQRREFVWQKASITKLIGLNSLNGSFQLLALVVKNACFLPSKASCNGEALYYCPDLIPFLLNSCSLSSPSSSMTGIKVINCWYWILRLTFKKILPCNECETNEMGQPYPSELLDDFDRQPGS